MSLTGTGMSPMVSDFIRNPNWDPNERGEAPSGFEPLVELLQSSALPLGHGAVRSPYCNISRAWVASLQKPGRSVIIV